MKICAKHIVSLSLRCRTVPEAQMLDAQSLHLYEKE
jgi:hypothetical protein